MLTFVYYLRKLTTKQGYQTCPFFNCHGHPSPCVYRQVVNNAYLATPGQGYLRSIQRYSLNVEGAGHVRYRQNNLLNNWQAIGFKMKLSY